MSWTRARAADFLADAFSNEIALAGILATDDVGGLKLTIDDALELMGVAEADIATAVVADADAKKYRVALTYSFLRRMLAFARGRAKSLSIPGVSKTYGDWTADLLRAIADAKADAALLFPALNEWGTAVLSGDYLEPEITYE